MKHLHQKHLHSQVEGLFTAFNENSNLRKLFRSSAEFEFSIRKIFQCGPLHERVNLFILFSNLESMLEIIGKYIEIKPIESEYKMHICSPCHIKEELPLGYPSQFLDTLKSLELNEIIEEGPMERVLSYALLANILYYIIRYFELNGNNHEY